MMKEKCEKNNGNEFFSVSLSFIQTCFFLLFMHSKTKSKSESAEHEKNANFSETSKALEHVL